MDDLILYNKHYSDAYSKLEGIERMNLQIMCQNIKDDSQKFGLCDISEAFLSFDDYHKIAELITFPEEYTIIDIGCCAGIQQVCFKKFKQYIGIDWHLEDDIDYRIINNAKFIKGDANNVLPNINLPREKVICVSVLCASYLDYNLLPLMAEKACKVISI